MIKTQLQQKLSEREKTLKANDEQMKAMMLAMEKAHEENKKLKSQLEQENGKQQACQDSNLYSQRSVQVIEELQAEVEAKAQLEAQLVNKLFLGVILVLRRAWPLCKVL